MWLQKKLQSQTELAKERRYNRLFSRFARKFRRVARRASRHSNRGEYTYTFRVRTHIDNVGEAREIYDKILADAGLGGTISYRRRLVFTNRVVIKINVYWRPETIKRWQSSDDYIGVK